jgi:RNase P/RNase MRP subunit POP5
VRRRYLALTVDSDEVPSSSEFMDAVWTAVSKLYGECGASRAGLSLISYDAERRLAVVRVAHVAVDMVRAAVATITRIDMRAAAVHVLAVSGTIKALHHKINA